MSLALVASLIGSTLAVRAQPTPVPSDWPRVGTLVAGSELIVTVKGAAPAHRYFVACDDSGLTVLNVDDKALPSRARDVLRTLASTHPEQLLAARNGQPLVLQKNVRVAPEGVFVADRKVADLAQVIQTISRNDVAEIASLVPSPGRDALAGFAVGAALAAAFSLLLCVSGGGCGSADVGPILAAIGFLGGVFAAIWLLPFGHGHHKSKAVIYRAT